MAIVDLDRDATRQRHRRDGWLVTALIAASTLFALAVWISRPGTVPAAQPAASSVSDTTVSSASVPRGVVLKPLVLPSRLDNVELAFMPDRLANEAPPWTLRSVVVIRGAPGVASIEGPAVISWTENGIAYWMVSSTRTISDLVQIANDLR